MGIIYFFKRSRNAEVYAEGVDGWGRKVYRVGKPLEMMSALAKAWQRLTVV
jgi:hypothetical protein